ncbi:SgcJ/EcaC family oxidoreductase [Nocardia uniformis]|uniref:SgcJ/EcaC family oxidoreductase n=1 Tax=Nocardia uniformis TaxID=53432 RepID=A0A849BY66_9NOCA|nr:SgcJ/EcaC family oxidoreductase [Nocardia uniformis]NNH71493.1 SgcJ/EcaC family oxidoreductase [Nocardia uniformis]
MTDTTTAETELVTLLRAQADAWAAGDGKAFAATFTPDADFVSVIGEFIRGREELAQVIQEGLDGFMKGTRWSEPLTRTIRFPTPDTAVMVTITPRPAKPGVNSEERSIQTRVAVRTNGTWLFTSFHNTHIQQFPPA